MTPSTMPGMASKKPPGRNIREAERNTVAVKLRLPPEVAEELDELAERLRMTRSGAVAWLLERRSPHDPNRKDER